MGHSGELARSAKMTKPSKDENGNTTYELGKPLYTKEVDQELKFLTEVVNDKFLTPLPPVWAGLPTQKHVLAVACGSYHILVSARNVGEFATSLYTSGLNQYGQLGHGDTVNRHELTAVRFRGECIRKACSIIC
jgi:alpha-tubulin suppressor-like RCC1 family protein